MNLTDAKRLAGITGQVSGREALQEAAKKCTRLAAKFHPDRNPSDKNAPATFQKLIAARDFFEKRMPHGCAVCGVTIGRGATHCRSHQNTRPQAIGCPPSKPLPRGRVSLVSDPLALRGYYAAKIQKIIRKHGNIRPDMLERYFLAIAETLVTRDTDLVLNNVAPNHWAVVFSIGQALIRFLNETDAPHRWLVTLPIHIIANGDSPSVKEIQKMIVSNGGPKFTEANIKTALKTLRLTTAETVKKDYFDSVTKAD